MQNLRQIHARVLASDAKALADRFHAETLPRPTRPANWTQRMELALANTRRSRLMSDAGGLLLRVCELVDPQWMPDLRPRFADIYKPAKAQYPQAAEEWVVAETRMVLWMKVMRGEIALEKSLKAFQVSELRRPVSAHESMTMLVALAGLLEGETTEKRDDVQLEREATRMLAMNPAMNHSELCRLLQINRPSDHKRNGPAKRVIDRASRLRNAPSKRASRQGHNDD